MSTPTDPHPSLIEKISARFKLKSKKRATEQKLRASIEELIEGHREDGGIIASDERELLGNVLDLRELTAADVMIQRADIIAIPQDITENELLNCFITSRLKRIPIYRSTLDEVLGIVQIQDVLSWKASEKPLILKSMIREVLFISPTMRTLDLLFQMRERGIRMALVIDEYGGIDGLVTFSDLMEEIIGDIRDARETNAPELTVRADNSIVADGRVHLDLIEEAHSLNLMVEDLEDEVETIGGLVSSLAGHVPIRGEVIKHPNKKIEFEILEADPRRVKRLLIKQI